MTIDEYKAKLDEYLGLKGELSLLQADQHSEAYCIAYSVNGVEIVKYRIVRSKIHQMPHGWYESGSRSTILPEFDPDTIANRENWKKKLDEMRAEGK